MSRNAFPQRGALRDIRKKGCEGDYPPPGVDAAMKHKKCEITAFRIEAYLRAKNVQTFQRVRLAKLPL